MKKILKNKKKLIMVLVPIIIVLIVVLIIGLTSGYKDTDYLIINNKGKLIGFKEYNQTKKMIVEYDNKGNRIDGTYDKGDLLIVLIKKEDKKEVVIPKEVKSIKKDLFVNIEYIDTLNIKMEIDNISDEMFRNSKFKKIILPSSVKSIGKRAFMDNVYLKEVNGSVSKIEESAFENDVSLKKIDLKESKEIGKRAFYGCNSIKKIYLSKKLKNIGEEAFIYLANESKIYVENFEKKLLVEGKYTRNKTEVIIDNKYFK